MRTARRRMLVGAIGIAGVLGIITTATAGIPIPLISLTADPGSLDLGSVVVGSSASANTVISTTNRDSVPWAGVALGTPPATITGANAAEFSLDSSVAGACTSLQVLVPTDSCTTRVVFTPTSSGPKTATLTVAGDTTLLLSGSVGSNACPIIDVLDIGVASVPTSPCFISIPITATALTPPTATTLTAPAGAVSVTPTPTTVRTGHSVTVVVTTSNTGEAPMQAATTALVVPSSLRVINAGAGKATASGLSWTTESIAGGGRESHTVTLRALSAQARIADLRVSLEATGITGSAAAKVKIIVPKAKKKTHRKTAVPVTG